MPRSYSKLIDTIVVCILLSTQIQLWAGSVDYHFNDSIPEGIVVENVPASIVDSSLQILIDEDSQKWSAKLLITVNQDIFENPLLHLRFRVGTTVAGTTANLAIILEIDDLYTQNGDEGTWRIYPTIDLLTAEWQELDIDLAPLIASWEATHGTTHGNVQEITIFIGNNNGPFVSDAFYLDKIHIGDRLNASAAYICPDNPAEICVDLGMPVTGVSNASNFTMMQDASSLEIDSVTIRNENTLVVHLQEEIGLPRDVMNLPTWQLGYNGNDEIRDADGNLLETFQLTVAYLQYVQNFWKYWGKFEKVEIPYPTPWANEDTISDGWDWSLPAFAEADSLAYFRYKNTPDLNFSCKNLNSVYVSWNELEPSRGQYNFQLLRDRIIENSEGYDGVVLRVLASVWNIDSYPDPGGFVPQWLADRDNAPRWMDQMDIAKIQSHKAIDGKYIITNMDIMDPDYHSLYKEFIEALGESGIPEMEELKIVNVCYRSASAGEEYTAYNPDRNAVEALYSASTVAQRTKERLKAWTDAFGDNTYKLMWVGHDEKAYIEYAGQLGMGSRNGFIEMYNSYVHMPQFGITINPETRYVEIDENNDFIRKDVAFGDENEEYDSELRFGWKESFAYRYYISSFRMLQMRRNYVMHAGNTLTPELTWYVGMGLARKIEDTPDAFALLSEFYLSSSANGGNAGPVKNIERWLYQRDLPGYETTPALQVPTAKDLWYADNTKPYDYTARKGKKMAFDIDDRLFPDGEQSMAIKISFYDGVAGSLKLVYENDLGIQEDSIVTTGTDQVKTATFFITARMDTALLDADSLEHDFELHSEAEVPVFFVRVIKTEEAYENTDQQPFEDLKGSIPGIIECEAYDEGQEGFAFHDDETKEGELSQRPSDNVDILSRSTASNGYVIGYTNEGEWLEYTVDVISGQYDITLYYYCGETAGDLQVGLNGKVLATISNMVNNGWEQRDSSTIRGIAVTGGENNILRLQFTNGAGFHLDAIRFTKAEIAVSGVTLTGCAGDELIPGDTLRLAAVITPGDAFDQSISWSSSDTSVATVDTNGLATAKGAGSAMIMVTTRDGGFTGSCAIGVRIPVTAVTIDGCPGSEMMTGTTKQLTGIVVPAGATDPSLNWNSSDTSVAKVNSDGLLSALAVGSSIISVHTTDGGFADSCVVTVAPDASNSIALSGPKQWVEVYPNPASDLLFIRFMDPYAEKRIRIYNAYGQLLISEITHDQRKEIDVSKISAEGIFIVQILSGKETVSHVILIEE